MAILKTAPEGAEVLDLGAARVARAEARGDVKQYIKLEAGFIAVKAEIPLSAAFAFKSENLRAGLELMLVDSADAEALLEDGLTAEDLKAISEFISGKSLGE